jgi:predicted GIY-YIG superfamily endonuclease
MKRLKAALEDPKSMSIFAEDRVGPLALARRWGIKADFSGCYVLIDGERPLYVGISRKVLNRLRQHVRGRTHFDASLAYRIALHRQPTAGKRTAVMQNPTFRKAFQGAKVYLSTLAVSFVSIENPLELYVFEAYAAMSLKTHQWNTFRTH